MDAVNVRATEYTVGEQGPEAMPAVLPPQSGYTYCVELDTLTDDNHHFAEKPLGEGESDPFGAYMISYDLEDIEGGDCECCTPADRANLIIEAYEEGPEKVLYRSPLIYQAEICQEVNLSVDKTANVDESEYKRLNEALAPCLDLESRRVSNQRLLFWAIIFRPNSD